MKADLPSMKLIAIVFTIFILEVIYLADHGALPPFLRAVYDFPNGDKLGHFILFGLLNYFITRAYLSSAQSDVSTRATLSIGLALAVFVTAEEYSQKFFPTRTFDLLDLTASVLGLIVGGWTALRLNHS